MSSDKCNSITAKATGLIFSLFDVASSIDVRFGLLQYVKFIDLPCPPLCSFLFVDNPKVLIHGSAMHGSHL